ncbi:MAG: oligoendopeptidase F [Chlamydiales bacterium]|nr:oligoendopeptidase F [Chlamydiales bacterium]
MSRLLITPIFFMTTETAAANNFLEKEPAGPKSRSEIPEQVKWDLAPLYPSFVEWEKDFQLLKGQEDKVKWPKLAAYKGKLADPLSLAELLEELFTLDRQLSKLSTYAHLKLDEDLGNDVNKHHMGLISQLGHDFQLEISWIEPELLSINRLEQMIKEAPHLKPFQFYLEKVARKKAHMLPVEQEELLALSAKALDTSYKAFGALNNADLTFESAVDSKGTKHPLSHGSYFTYVNSPDRLLRKSAFMHLHQGFKNHANTLCELLQGLVESHVFTARARNFKSCLHAALFPHNVDPAVYTQLIQTVKTGLPLMHEYIALRKKALKLDQIHAYDLYVPFTPKADITMSYPEACQAVIESVVPLGTEYQNILRKGLTTDRWVDVYENKKKRSGGYSSGCYDSMPYILINYHGTLKDVLTLAHEAGHSMHSYLSRENQSYVNSQYPIFVAEVASTFNEQLLLKYLLSKAKTKEQKAMLIYEQIEGIRGTIFRQTLFAEFELQLHRWIEEGVPLTPTLLNEAYLELNKNYYGPDFVLDQELAFEWARIPHFYYDFYVYQYATGLSAALELFQQTSCSTDACAKYLQFLSAGGSRYPLDLLKIAGVDMTSKKPVESALHYFKELIMELKNCLDFPVGATDQNATR